MLHFEVTSIYCSEIKTKYYFTYKSIVMPVSIRVHLLLEYVNVLQAGAEQKIAVGVCVIWVEISAV